MTNSVAVIPDQLPAYLQGGIEANDEALSGLSLGGFPHIKLNGTRFQAVEGDNEINIPLLELPVVVLRAAPGLRKAWYGTKYNPNSSDPGRGPDCFSHDGTKPHGSSPTPQCKTCAACPHNAFGSGKDQDGNPTKGKACSDNKQLAVFSQAPSKAGAENQIFGMKLPPASLKNFAVYVKSLSSKRVPLAAALTMVSFDDAFSYPVLAFKFGGLLNEAQYAKIQEMAHSSDAEDIIAALPDSGAPVAVAAPVPVAEPANAVDDLGLGDTIEVAPKAKSATKAKATPKAEVVELDFGLGDVAPAQAAPVDVDMPPDEDDDDLAKQLGLM